MDRKILFTSFFVTLFLFNIFAAVNLFPEENDKEIIREDARQLLFRAVDYFQSIKDRDFEKEKSFLSDKMRERKDKIAKDQHSCSLAVEALLLHSKLARIEGNSQLARQYLDKAERTAKRKGLELLLHRIKKQQEV